MLEIAHVDKHFGRKVVLDDVSVTAHPSDTLVVVGTNGSGKSTLLRIACGILEPSRGSVAICGHSLDRHPERAKAQLGYAPDGMEALPDLLVSEFVALVRTLKPRLGSGPAALAQEWKERLGVGAFWEQRVGSLSFGQRKRVAILAALSGNPPVLLLDEPTNGLDELGVALVGELVEERARAGAVTVLSTNDMSFADTIAGKVHRLHAGKLSAS